jgi:hypothetical protein
MPKQRWVVRVILHRQYPETGLSQLKPDKPNDAFIYDDMGTRYQGLTLWINLLGPHTRLVRDSDEGVCFDIFPPGGISDTHQWANMHSDKIKSFGINAVAAPETTDYLT